MTAPAEYSHGEPPGQLELYPRPLPGPTVPKLCIVTAGTCSAPERDLTMAALKAAAAAKTYGEAWLVAPDHSHAHVAQDGTVQPNTGWATVAQLIINRRNTP